MDVYTKEIDDTKEDGEITCVYDIEPNNYHEEDIPRRNRYYQSMIESKLLPTGTVYKKLPDMFSIWILLYDPFGDKRMVYAVRNIVTENNQIVYNDGADKEKTREAITIQYKLKEDKAEEYMTKYWDDSTVNAEIKESTNNN